MVTIDVKADGMIARLRRIEQATENLVPAFNTIRIYTDRKTQQTFDALKRGGTHRSVTWKWFAPQYTRKTDGMVVPAQGGVPKLYGRGLVQGRLRPSGTRVTTQSNLMRDTGDMRSQALNNWRIARQRMRCRLYLKYAAKQQSMRPFFFWEVPVDTKYIRNTITS